MKLIKPSWEILEQKPGLEDIYEQIELSGRTCYKSQAKYQYRNPLTNDVYEPDFVGTWKVSDDRIGITTTAEDFYNKEGIFIKESTTAKGFVDRMIKSQHYAMLEHGTVYLYSTYDVSAIGSWYDSIGRRYSENKYSVVNTDRKMDFRGIYVTTNLRVLVENGWLDDLKYLCKPTEFHEKRVTVRFVSNIHFYKDLTRHRSVSFAIESTRYCNYSRDKFDNQLTFISPVWTSLEEGTYADIDSTYGYTVQFNNTTLNLKKDEYLFLKGLQSDEEVYLGLIECGWQPQQAAEKLPQATKAEIICTGFVSDWNWIFKLRSSEATTGKAHPELIRLMDPLKEEFIKRKYIQ